MGTIIGTDYILPALYPWKSLSTQGFRVPTGESMTENFAARDAWNAATELLRAEGKLSDSQLAFVRLARPLATVDEIFMIAVGSDFVKDWISQHVRPIMTQQLSAILGREVKLMISVDPALTEQAVASTPVAALSTAAKTSEPEISAPSTSTFTSTSLSSEIEEIHAKAESRFHRAFGNNEYESDLSTANEAAIASVVEDADDDYFGDFSEVTGDFPGENMGGQGTNQPYRSYGSQVAELDRLRREANLNPRYTFDTFVIGESNRFAHATAFAVAEAPGTSYNPLFFYSEPGMGKTHLLHAIGNYTLSLYPNKKVLYISAEEFANIFINAVRAQEMRPFKEHFRNVDVLLIDDIQFISTKEKSSEEFFHTFNALSSANKQIVVTSDVPPKHLKGFDERMISRFASGITASIDLPNLETRIAILEKKANTEALQIPRQVLEFIASRLTTNVREMEGCLRRIAAYADLSQQHVTLDMAELVLRDIFSDPQAVQITAGIIMTQTASYFNISVDDLKSPSRTRNLTTPRHISMYLCREMTDYSLPKIAELFNRRDHTTVINAIKNVEQQMAEKQSLYTQVSELTSRIRQAAKENAQQRD